MSTATVMQAYRFALDPTFAQVGVLARNAGAARFAFNHLLARIRPSLRSARPRNPMGSPATGFTPDQGWSLPALRRTWNQVEDEFPKVDATLMNLWGWTAADPTSFRKSR